MATEKWIAGAVTTWQALFGTEINSLPNGSGVISSVVFDNTVNLDVFSVISINLGSVTPTGGFIGIYWYELNTAAGASGSSGLADGTVYGDGRFGSAAVGPPPSLWTAALIPCVAAAGIITGVVSKVPLPLKKAKAVLYNGSGVSLAATLNNVSIQRFNSS